ncbi:NADP-dependent glyceraldehyde-3-phosphate dehydrogenase [Thermaurantimonas aggregans]|uniref:NADP-dependent glyceraldehyde-3-phosphate dehydrogenase n=1 Tax=Thermaurantimonas aggregans TaxID=2173829 RepID=A0A401XL87_9FLAO|nr:NADP-dependent glyceraldehyde-3-phosphate dehydrogenase [Thermaurantimonas aggregans]MCX8148146.1 NADP-dependent glyceraldehyde-3-phosphate dehydrogenase [Thermaurantimonas aggregans]GCD77786.1 NADP-dependent glyceraldehyde-3-phosphate dehydrogenase [Thermaurantimonas aggregans]
MNQYYVQVTHSIKPNVLEIQDYLLDGKIVPWNGPFSKVYSPIKSEPTGESLYEYLGSYPDMDEAAALEALNAACKAYDRGRGLWPTMAVEERIAAVEKFAKLATAQREQIVQLLMWEIGKSRTDAEKEFDRTIEYIYLTVDELKNLERTQSRFVIEKGIIGQIRRTPLGVVLVMGPYNYPFNETYTLVIPALIMGNTVVMKPPRPGVLMHYYLQKAFQEAFPPGVINYVYGKGSVVVPPLMQSGRVNVLAMIGTSRVADSLKKMHPKSNRLKSILGLDAKNPAIILPDADISAAASECITGAFSFNGQRCTAIKIIFVHRSLAEAFLKEFSAKADALKVGLPWEDKVNITPLADENKPKYLQEIVEDALQKGASIQNAHGGIRRDPFYSPTVLYPVNDSMRIYHEEQFGPVVPVVPYNDIEEIFDYLENSKYGQQVSIFGNSPVQIGHLTDQLVNMVSRVNINSQCQRGPDILPFTGRKDSAEGTLSVYDALRSFSIRSVVAAKMEENSKTLLREIVNQGHSNFISTRYVF